MNDWPEYLGISMEHPFDKEFQLCSNEVPGVTSGYFLRGHNFILVYIHVYSNNI